MQTLTAMTLGALALGAAALLYDASAHSAVACSGREASIQFENGKADMDDLSRAIVERMAAEAKACGVDTVVAEADGKRAAALAKAFRPTGVKLVTADAPRQPASAASVRLTVGQDI
jgi:hypothetical protein